VTGSAGHSHALDLAHVGDELHHAHLAQWAGLTHAALQFAVQHQGKEGHEESSDYRAVITGA
jgi:hypothetical protein